MGRKRQIDPHGVKFIECVPKSRLLDSKVVQSILKKVFPSCNYEFVFCKDGELVVRRYRHLMVQRDNEVATLPFNRLVTIHRNDGTSEYGLVGFDYVDVLKRKELTSIYVSKIRNPNTGEWEWPGTLYGERTPGDRIGNMMAFYNENLDLAIDEKDKAKVKYPFGTMDDYMRIYALTHYDNDWVTRCPQGVLPEIEPELGTRYVATKYRFSKPPDGFEKWNGLYSVFYTWKKSFYLKSVYRNVTDKRLRKELFALDDLIMIRKVNPESFYQDNEEEKVVWTSLDETCKGNV